MYNKARKTKIFKSNIVILKNTESKGYGTMEKNVGAIVLLIIVGQNTDKKLDSIISSEHLIISQIKPPLLISLIFSTLWLLVWSGHF